MSPVDFKKRQCRSVEFRGQVPQNVTDNTGFFLETNMTFQKAHPDYFKGPFFVAWGSYYFHLQSNFSLYKLKCCEFKGKQAFKIESTSLCCRSYSVLHVICQKNEWSIFVEYKVSGQTVMPQCLSSAWKGYSGWLHQQPRF